MKGGRRSRRVGPGSVHRTASRWPLLPAVLIGMLALAQAGPAYGASPDWIHVSTGGGYPGDAPSVYRVTSAGGLTQIYQSPTYFEDIAVNPANGDIATQTSGGIRLLDSSGQVRREFFGDGVDVKTRQMDPQDCGREVRGIDWLASDRVVWSTQYTETTPTGSWNPASPDCSMAVVRVGDSVGHLWSTNPYADSSGAVLAKAPVAGARDPTATGHASDLSVSPDGRILAGIYVDSKLPSEDNPEGYPEVSYGGAVWAYPRARQAEVWIRRYDRPGVIDLCVDPSGIPVLLVEGEEGSGEEGDDDYRPPFSRVLLPTRGKSIDLGAEASALACSPDTADQYALAMLDGRIMVGGSGGFQQVAHVGARAPRDIDWPGFSSSSGSGSSGATPRVRVRFPRHNGRYRRSRFRSSRGGVSNAGNVSRVLVSLQRRRGRRCQWLSRRGFRGRSCSKPVYLRARGVSSWKVRLSNRQRRALKPGRYTLGVRLNDSSGNQMAAEGQTRVRFRIRQAKGPRSRKAGTVRLTTREAQRPRVR